MNNVTLKKGIVVGLLIIFTFSSCIPAFGFQIKKLESNDALGLASWSEIKYIEIEINFSDLEIVKHGNYWIVRVNETNHNRITLLIWTLVNQYCLSISLFLT